VVQYLKQIDPDLLTGEAVPGGDLVFDDYDIEAEIRSLSNPGRAADGGYLIIQPTEALVVDRP